MSREPLAVIASRLASTLTRRVRQLIFKPEIDFEVEIWFEIFLCGSE